MPGAVINTFFAEWRTLCEELAWYRHFGEDVNAYLAEQGESSEDAFTTFREARDKQRATEAKQIKAKQRALGTSGRRASTPRSGR